MYVAEQAATKKLRALKVMRPEIVASPRMRERFLQEAQIGARIDSEHVVEVIDAGIDEETSTPWLAMELLKGSTLAAWIAREGPMSPALARQLFLQLSDAMGAAHSAGIVHRDLKPDNLFLTQTKREGFRFTLKVLDFGIAKLISEASTQSTGAIGTPMFMPPEQMVPGGAITPAADVWAMGLIAFYVLTGRPYWQSGNLDSSTPMMLLNEVTSLPIVAPTLRLKALGVEAPLPAGFDEWFLKCVNRVLDYRFADANELRAGLDSFLPQTKDLPPAQSAQSVLDSLGDTAPVHVDSGTIAAPPLPAPTSTDFVAHQPSLGSRSPARRPYWLVLGGLAALGGIVLVAGQLGQRDQPSTGVAPAADAESSEPATEAPIVQSISIAADPLPPRLGLKAVIDFEDPGPQSVQSLRSKTMWQAAAADFHEACARPSAPARWCAGEDFANGQIALMKGRGKEAVALFESAIRKDPAWAAPHLGLAFARSGQNDLTAATEAFQHAQRLAPGSWLAVAAGARVYAAHDKFDEAIEEFKRAEALAPSNALLLGQVALMYHAARMDQEATRYATRALELEPELTLVRLMLAERALERGDGRTALAEAERAIASEPKFIDAHAARGDALSLLGRKEDARAAYRKVVELLSARDDETPPGHRLSVIRDAMAKGELPSPRVQQPGKSQTQPSGRSAPYPTSSPDRSRPPPAHPGCACAPADLTCAMKCSVE